VYAKGQHVFEAKHQRILALWQAGMTAANIGVRLGMSRGAVIGIVSRLRQAGHNVENRARGSMQPEPAQVRAERRPRTPSSASRQNRHHVVPVPAAPAPAAPVRSAEPRDLLDLGPNACHFVVNDHAPWLFCAAPTEAGSVWCPAHRRRVYTPVKPYTVSSRQRSWLTKIR
jgi:hypothetical protein